MLFNRLAAASAGRPIDEQRFGDGPWTDETLADAILSFEANRNGIELRAVQVWCQENKREATTQTFSGWRTYFVVTIRKARVNGPGTAGGNGKVDKRTPFEPQESSIFK